MKYKIFLFQTKRYSNRLKREILTKYYLCDYSYGIAIGTLTSLQEEKGENPHTFIYPSSLNGVLDFLIKSKVDVESEGIDSFGELIQIYSTAMGEVKDIIESNKDEIKELLDMKNIPSELSK